MKTLKEELIKIMLKYEEVKCFIDRDDYGPLADDIIHLINSNAQDESLNISDNEDKRKICGACCGSGVVDVPTIRGDCDVSICRKCKGDGHI